MKKALTVAAVVFFAVSAIVPATAGPVPKPTESAGVTKVSLPPAKPFKFGLRQQKDQTPIRVSPICWTPGGNCWVPGFGYCYCCFGIYGCYNGHT